MSKALSVTDIAEMIDHSLLRPSLTASELEEGIALAERWRCATVCVAPYDVARAAALLDGSPVRVSTVIDFPHGSNTTETKLFQVRKALDNGARELDMVLAISRLVSEDFDYVESDVRAVVAAAHERQAIVKVIFETSYLNARQIVMGCQICERAGADYVKTSTGYGPSGAKLQDVRLMRKSCSEKVAVKAAGGIRSLEEVLAFRAVGARMIGTRATEAIMAEAAIRDRAGILHQWQ